jgi:glycosyltransferase involved in cell wall biosynthesis
MDDPTIAAVIPLHNKENFVARAVASVLAQSRPVDEILVVDDASTDGSLGMLEAFPDPRLRILRRGEPGPGGYAARNVAIRAATSRWIAFLDADDSWKEGFIAEIAGLIARAPDTVGCVFTGYEKVWSNGIVVHDSHSVRHAAIPSRQLDFETFLTEWIALRSAPIWTSACVIRRDVLLAAGLFPEGRCRRGGDKDTWLRTLARTDALATPRALATYYTVTENQVTRQETFNTRPCLLATVEELISGADGERRTLLQRLFNIEIFEYALMIGSGERVTADLYRGYFVSLNPFRYVALLGLTHLPRPLPNLLRRVVFRSRSLIRRGRLALARGRPRPA